MATKHKGMPSGSGLPEVELLLDCVDSKPNLTILLSCIQFPHKGFLAAILPMQVGHILSFVGKIVKEWWYVKFLITDL